MDRWGVNYGWLDLVRIGFRPLKDEVSPNDGIICSELVAQLLVAASLSLPEPFPSQEMAKRISDRAMDDFSLYSPKDAWKMITGE